MKRTKLKMKYLLIDVDYSGYNIIGNIIFDTKQELIDYALNMFEDPIMDTKGNFFDTEGFGETILEVPVFDKNNLITWEFIEGPTDSAIMLYNALDQYNNQLLEIESPTWNKWHDKMTQKELQELWEENILLNNEV